MLYLSYNPLNWFVSYNLTVTIATSGIEENLRRPADHIKVVVVPINFIILVLIKVLLLHSCSEISVKLLSAVSIIPQTYIFAIIHTLNALCFQVYSE